MTTEPLILTLAIDAASFERFDALRRAHFPAGLNKVPAHVTLFHQLPGEAEAEVAHELRSVCAGARPFAVRVTGLRNTGRGVAYLLAASELSALRTRLAQRWAPWLAAQDRRVWSPHLTVQNKADPGAARALLDRLSIEFRPFDLRAEGLLLWRYLGGPWEAAGSFPFATGRLGSRAARGPLSPPSAD